MRLWDATPGNFRELRSPGARPSIIAPLPPPPMPTIAVSESETPKLTLQAMNLEPPFELARSPPLDDLTTTNSSRSSERGPSTRTPTTPGTSVHQSESTGSLLSKPSPLPFRSPSPIHLVDDLDVYHHLETIGSCGRFTSNEWAMACYGVDLGGPLWDLNEPSSCVEPEPVVEKYNPWLPWELGCVIC